VEVSAIGLGGWELRGGDTSAGEPSVEQAKVAIEAAIAEGVDWLDTAEVYHERRNESLIGEALRGIRDQISIATKVAPDASGFRPEQVHAACRASLDRLGTDHVEIYFLHFPDEDGGVPLDETWGAMAELVEEGLVRAIGLSNYLIADIEACNEARAVDAVQQGLSLLDHLEERTVIARCHELGIGAVVYEPLANGILTGVVSGGADLKTSLGDEIETFPFYERLLAPGRLESSLKVVDGVRAVAARIGVTPGQIAIAWTLAQPGVSSAIAGSRNPVHVRENAAAAALSLTDDDLAELDALIPLGPTF
jgi:aryl-alcohol dehydrogenase-like predicted oxidoreductase